MLSGEGGCRGDSPAEVTLRIGQLPECFESLQRSEKQGVLGILSGDCDCVFSISSKCWNEQIRTL